MKRWLLILFVIMFAAILAACGANNEDEEDIDENTETEEDAASENDEQGNQDEAGSTDEEMPDNAAAEEEVLVSMEDAEGNVVATATLTEGDEGVNILLDAEGLPAGTKGFHIHENAECEAPDFESAGGHYNPTDANHGFDDPDGPHAGDLPNIEIQEDGTASEEVTADMVTLDREGENSLYADGGTALVIHSDADDYVSQPAGDAGNRIACGVISE
ncbi:superoxide dismutase family protein [Virgibacillus sp. YIM 98842]|uniref:superoxide dismutase family protein n=1 Tax=Virgibacillus sp. YIM 98842 TaxID=2663533 RepID=UPI0013DA2E51|nr:superoxide dismutase family protein [Virgibacillus sp. YIM 98842]